MYSRSKSFLQCQRFRGATERIKRQHLLSAPMTTILLGKFFFVSLYLVVHCTKNVHRQEPGGWHSGQAWRDDRHSSMVVWWETEAAMLLAESTRQDYTNDSSCAKPSQQPEYRRVTDS